MPNPAALHANRPLDNVAIAFQTQEFIANEVLPIIKVNKKSDSYYIYGREHQGRPVTLIAPKGVARQVDYALSSDTYNCLKYGLGHLIEDDERDNADNAVADLDQDAIELTSDLIKLDREVRVRNLLFTSTNYASTNRATLTGSDQFDDANSNPIEVCKDWRDTVRRLGGAEPTLLVMGKRVWRSLEDHPLLLKRYEGLEPMLRKQAIAELLGYKAIKVGSAVYDGADEGQTFDGTEIWDDKIAGYYVPPAFLNGGGEGGPQFFGKKTPTFAAQFVWKYFYTKKRRDPDDRGDIVECFEHQDEKICGNTFGFLLSDVLGNWDLS